MPLDAAALGRALGDCHATRARDSSLLQRLPGPQQTAEFDNAEEEHHEYWSDQRKFDRRRPSACRRQAFRSGFPHCVSTSTLRLIVPLGTKPKVGNSAEMVRFAMIVTNWPAIPLPPGQVLPQVTALPQLQFPGDPLGQ